MMVFFYHYCVSAPRIRSVFCSVICDNANATPRINHSSRNNPSDIGYGTLQTHGNKRVKNTNDGFNTVK